MGAKTKHHKNLLKLNILGGGCFCFHFLSKSWIFLKFQSFSWKIAFNLGISDFACFKSKVVQILNNLHFKFENTPATRGWSRLRNRTLAVPKKTRENQFFFRKKIKNYLKFFFSSSDIPFSYATILGETNFQTREFPRSGLKAEGVGEKRRRKK